MHENIKHLHRTCPHHWRPTLIRFERWLGFNKAGYACPRCHARFVFQRFNAWSPVVQLAA
jgi:hypothetical protein